MLLQTKTRTSTVSTRKKSGFENLSPEQILKTFGFLSINSLKNASLVSKTWHHVSCTKQLWIESIILINFKDVSNLDYILNLTKLKLVNELKLVIWLYPPRYVSDIFKSSKIDEMYTITIRKDFKKKKRKI